MLGTLTSRKPETVFLYSVPLSVGDTAAIYLHLGLIPLVRLIFIGPERGFKRTSAVNFTSFDGI